ncbi:hypothetical protein MTR67_030141 [Solanum verrucosum]|uniref:Uncharacterized protein n=1 Tax=Solanum verrucosum TaxID=315347 RepID=A0AAF0TXX0_SOLVR|nr:hypothetical protein MTR67_030141 [Solanum verrucosum]
MGPPLYPSPLKYRASLCILWGLNLRPKSQILHLLPLELGLGRRSQSRFLKGRAITGNILLAQDIGKPNRGGNIIMSPLRAVRGRPANRNIDEQELPNAPEV